MDIEIIIINGHATHYELTNWRNKVPMRRKRACGVGFELKDQKCLFIIGPDMGRGKYLTHARFEGQRHKVRKLENTFSARSKLYPAQILLQLDLTA